MKKILIPVLVTILAGGGYYLYRQNETTGEEGTLTLYGNVDIRDVSLGFRVAGRIAAMRFEEGDQIKRGDVMAVLDKGPFLDDLALAQAKLDEASALAANALKIYRRRAKLLKTNAVSQDQYDEALANRDATRAHKVSAEAQLNLVRSHLADTEIHAPDDGIILTRVREPGAIVAQGANVYVLALSHPVWVRTYIDEPLLGRVYPGQKAKIFTDTGGEYDGQVGFISPQAEFTPKNVETTQLRTDLVYRMRIIADNPDKGLRRGMPVTVKIYLHKKGDGDGG